MDQMTEEQKSVVEELRSRTIRDATPKMLEDVSVFYRFAKAREFNLEDAETMLRNHISFRKEMKIDTILTDYKPPEVLLKYAPTNFICFDKNGCIVRLNDCGRADAPALWNVATKTDWIKFYAQVIEQDIERMINRGGNLGKPLYAVIDDFDKLTYSNAISVKNLQYMAFILKLFADHYPETLKTLTIINTPSYFTWLWSALKPLLPPAITQKIRLFGTDGWKELLLEEIDPDDLPAYLGGNRTDPDGNPFCESFIKHGRKIPKCYYPQHRWKKLSVEPGVEKIAVMPLSKQEISFEVKEANSCLEWEFQTKSGDIDFILKFRRETSDGFELEELIPRQRIDSNFEPEKGFFKCEKLGHYVIVFDNSHSWFHMKEVFYRAGVTTAQNYDFNSRYTSSSFS